ncbi:MAG: nucleotidyl transferase AbiEii/AbiGii toxin family protein [Pseudomonadales bacterium]
MDKGAVYYRQVQLLVQVLPLIAGEKCFALKGGTAINLFVRELPRLSVDIDLVYLPIKSRDESLGDIQRALGRISDVIEASLAGADVHKSYEDKPDALRLIVRKEGVQIKVELSPVLRGTVYAPVAMSVTESAENEFGYVEMLVVSVADLYAGKICAALDRQHPRDLFDIKFLLENEGITDEVRKASLVYLISHNRPIAELLSPILKDISTLYKSEFSRMTEIVITVDDLVVARQQLIEQLTLSITDDEKEFLMSFKRGNPSWDLLGLEGVEDLPAVKWKQLNLKNMSVNKHAQALGKLQAVLDQF